MPVSVRYRDGLLRQELQAEERAVTPGLSHPAAHPSVPPQPPGFAMSAHGTAQPRVPTEMGPPVPSSTRAMGTAQTKLPLEPKPKSSPHWVKRECANDSHKAKLHPLLGL